MRNQQTKTFLLIAIFLFVGTFAFAQVSINTSGAQPDASSMLDVNSTDKGFLPPRITTIQRDAISNPAEGLQIFNTSTKCLEFYVDGSWQNIACSCPVPDPTTATSATNITAAGDVSNDPTLPTGLISYWELEEASGTRVDSKGPNDLADNNTGHWSAVRVG